MKAKTIERASIAALLYINGIGHAAIQRVKKYLIKHELSWDEFWVLSTASLSKIGLSEKQIYSISRFKNEHTVATYYESLLVRDIAILLTEDDEYPVLLKQISQPPVGLFVRGSSCRLRGQPIAVVGTRKVTAYGQYVTELLVTQLAHRGCGIISGGMYGVDMVAHQAALAAGAETWVILGHGFDHTYPESLSGRHRELVVAGAVCCSPFAPDVQPTRYTFPIRNRVVAGISSAVIVTEAAEKSGSHITAQAALEEGRAVFAVPGPITNPYCAGTHSLLQQGAGLCLSGRQVLDEMDSTWGDKWEVSSELAGEIQICGEKKFSDVQQRIVVEAIQSGASNIQTLLACTQLHIEQLSQVMSILELEGSVISQGGQIFLKRKYKK